MRNLQPYVPGAASLSATARRLQRRVVQKAIDAVYRDGLGMRSVLDRLARDFWVRPDEKMVWLRCSTYAAEIDFAVDYQPRVVANFSGILCVDEVYQGDLALLLAVNPAAPDGDRLVGYALLQRSKRSINVWSGSSSIAYGRQVSIRTKSSLTTRACTPQYWLTSGPGYAPAVASAAPRSCSARYSPSCQPFRPISAW